MTNWLPSVHVPVMKMLSSTLTVCFIISSPDLLTKKHIFLGLTSANKNLLRQVNGSSCKNELKHTSSFDKRFRERVQDFHKIYAKLCKTILRRICGHQGVIYSIVYFFFTFCLSPIYSLVLLSLRIFGDFDGYLMVR